MKTPPSLCDNIEYNPHSLPLKPSINPPTHAVLLSSYLYPMQHSTPKLPDPNDIQQEGQTLLEGVSEQIPDGYDDDIFKQLDDLLSNNI